MLSTPPGTERQSDLGRLSGAATSDLFTGRPDRLVRCVFALQFCYQSGSWRQLPSFTMETIITPHATALVPALDAPSHECRGASSCRPGSRLDRRSIASPTSTTTAVQSHTPDGCLRNLCAGLPVHAYRLRFRMVSQSWTLRAQSELPGVCATFFRGRLPGSQVLRSWLCSLQWFLIENRHNLPIVGTETPGLFHGRRAPPPFRNLSHFL